MGISDNNPPLLAFLKAEIALIAASSQAHLSEVLISDVVDQALHHYKQTMTPEERHHCIKKLIAEEKSRSLGTQPFKYRPPFAFKNRTTGISEASMDRAVETLSEIYPFIINAVDTNLVMSMQQSMQREAMLNYLTPIILQGLDKTNKRLNATEKLVLESMCLDEMIGLGPLEPLLADNTVTDILVNTPSQVYVERFGKLQLSSVVFRDKEHIMHIISRIVSLVGRRVDSSRPYVDARLEDGTRINAIIPPLALDSPTLSIRKFNRQPFHLDEMITRHSLSSAMATLLTIAVRSRMNIIVSGGTGSGKTTFLNALSYAIAPTERIITIEDSAELNLQQEHVVRLETRESNLEGRGSFTERDLVKNALRMRPDRIILGEVRGAEAFDMLQAMNTGHDGSMSTIHANSPQEVPSRLADMLAMASVGLNREASLRQISSIIDLIVHTSRLSDGSRRVVKIAEVVGFDAGRVVLHDLFEYQYVADGDNGVIKGSFVCTRATVEPRFLAKASHCGLDNILKMLFQL